MRWNDPHRLNLLAGEFVLGTLQGPGRRRLERELPKNRMLRSFVEEWEQRMIPLGLSLQPMEPPAKVWNLLQRQLGPKAKTAGLWHHLGFWRSLGIFASSVALLFLVYFGSHGKMFWGQQASYVSMLMNEKAQSTWMVSLGPKMESLEVKAMHPMSLPPDKSYELWMLPGGGQAPISLGLMPMSGSMKMPLPEKARAAVAQAQGLAVSLEPAGGSPTGAPTGPVQFQGSLISVI